MDEYEREAAVDAGLDPDDPEVAEAIDRVRYDLKFYGMTGLLKSEAFGAHEQRVMRTSM